MSNNKGFTIIELIVVIAIIAVLAGIVLVNVQGYTNKAKDASMKSAIKQMYTLAQTVYEQTGSYLNTTSDPQYLVIQKGTKQYSKEQFFDPIRGRYRDANSFCIWIDLFDGSKWCADWTGYVGLVGASYCNDSNNVKCK